MTFSIALMTGPWAGAAVLERLGASTLWIGALVTALAGAWITWSVSPGGGAR
jgi:hypothetical protein